MPNVATWSLSETQSGSTDTILSDQLSVFTNSNGVVTLTIAAGSVPYYVSSSNPSQVAPQTPAGSSVSLVSTSNPLSLQLYAGTYSGNGTVDLTIQTAPQSGVANSVSVGFQNASGSSITSDQAGTAINVVGTVTDAYGNPVSGAYVYVSGAGVAAPTSGTTTTTVTTNSSGQYTASFTPTQAGNETITVQVESTGTYSSTGVLAKQTANLTVTPGQVAGADITAASPNTLYLGPTSGTTQTVNDVMQGGQYQLTLSAVDAYGNPVQGTGNVYVYFVPAGSGTGAGTLSTSSGAIASGTSASASGANATEVSFNAQGQAVLNYTASSNVASGTPDEIYVYSSSTATSPSVIITLE